MGQRTGEQPAAEIHVTDGREPGWSWTDNELYDVHARSIGAIGVAVYGYLCRLAGGKRPGTAHPGIPNIARVLDVSEPTVRKYLDRLAAAGMIIIRPRETTVGDADSHEYVVLSLKGREGVVNVVDQGSPTTLTTPSTSLTRVVNDVDPTNKDMTKKRLDGHGAVTRSEVADLLFGYFGSVPHGAIVQDVMDNIARYATQNIIITAENVRQAVDNALKWRGDNGYLRPTNLSSFNTALANIVNPVPKGKRDPRGRAERGRATGTATQEANDAALSAALGDRWCGDPDHEGTG